MIKSWKNRIITARHAYVSVCSDNAESWRICFTQEDVTSACDVNYDDVNLYLTAIRASDQALKRFIEELKTREKPINVCFWDYPNLNCWIYELAVSKE